VTVDAACASLLNCVSVFRSFCFCSWSVLSCLVLSCLVNLGVWFHLNSLTASANRLTRTVQWRLLDEGKVTIIITKRSSTGCDCKDWHRNSKQKWAFVCISIYPALLLGCTPKHAPIFTFSCLQNRLCRLFPI
jgi:hypothetical protein